MFRTDKNAEVQLNIPEEINFSKNLFILTRLCFFEEQVLKAKHHQRNKLPEEGAGGKI